MSVFSSLHALPCHGADPSAAAGGVAPAPEEQYRAACSGVAVLRRTDRGRLTVTGVDAKEWLHRLVTNAVAELSDGMGCYAFALDARGRILFDLNILAIESVLWLDVARSYASLVLRHLDRYVFTEDVRLADASDHDARLACTGPRSRELAAALGVPEFDDLRPLESRRLATDVHFVRHAFVGYPGFELILPREQAGAWWQRLVQAGGCPVEPAIIEVLRIEAGLPALGRDLDENVLPAETGQLSRAVSSQKGCYVGHEIVERMRSRGLRAQRLVRLRMDAADGLMPPVELTQDGRNVGRVTSLARHPVTADWVGLGYLRTGVVELTGITAGEPRRVVEVLGDAGALTADEPA
jgi:folate-binding protein YgfZ